MPYFFFFKYIIMVFYKDLVRVKPSTHIVIAIVITLYLYNFPV